MNFRKVWITACVADMLCLVSLVLMVGGALAHWGGMFAAGVLFAAMSALCIAASCCFAVSSMRSEEDFPGPKVIGWCKFSDEFVDWYSGNHTGTEEADAEESIVREIRRRGYRFGGHYHQYGDYGCPVMEDGTVWMVSMRAWGEIMGRAWGGDYTEYAWSDDMGKVPSEAAEPMRKTDEQKDDERKAREEAERKAKEEWDRREMERARKKAERDEENGKAIKKYLSVLSRRYVGNARGLVEFMRKELCGIMERCRDQTHGEDYKWVLFDSERKRVKKSESEARRKLLDSLNANANLPKENDGLALEEEKNG